MQGEAEGHRGVPWAFLPMLPQPAGPGYCPRPAEPNRKPLLRWHPHHPALPCPTCAHSRPLGGTRQHGVTQRSILGPPAQEPPQPAPRPGQVSVLPRPLLPSTATNRWVGAVSLTEDVWEEGAFKRAAAFRFYWRSSPPGRPCHSGGPAVPGGRGARGAERDGLRGRRDPRGGESGREEAAPADGPSAALRIAPAPVPAPPPPPPELRGGRDARRAAGRPAAARPARPPAAAGPQAPPAAAPPPGAPAALPGEPPGTAHLPALHPQPAQEGGRLRPPVASAPRPPRLASPRLALPCPPREEGPARRRGRAPAGAEGPAERPAAEAAPAMAAAPPPPAPPPPAAGPPR